MPKWIKVVLFIVMGLAGLYLFGHLVWSSDPKVPPRGFLNETLLKLAVAIKWIDLVDTNPPADDSILEIHDIPYKIIDDDTLLLDIYRSKTLSGPVPGLIFIHGGGWRSGKKEDYRLYLLSFARKGFVTVSINYRLAKTAHFPAAIQDAKCAVQWIHAHARKFRIDPEQLALIGGSAGGHLSMMVGYSSDDTTWGADCDPAFPGSRVRAVVNLYGPVDLTTEYGRSHSLTKGFIGHPYQEHPELYRRASPRFYISQDDPPTLTFHGTIDGLVPISQADSLDRWLEKAGVYHEYHRLEGWPHAMDLARPVNEYVQSRMLEFLNRVFKNESIEPAEPN